MVGAKKCDLEKRLLASGVSKKEVYEFIEEIGEIHLPSDVLSDVEVCFVDRRFDNASELYKTMIKTLNSYVYPNSIRYVSNNMLSKVDQNLSKNLEALKMDYLSCYVNFLDLNYKHSGGTEFLSKLFSSNLFDEESIKKVISEDVELRNIKSILPETVYSAIY